MTWAEVGKRRAERPQSGPVDVVLVMSGPHVAARLATEKKLRLDQRERSTQSRSLNLRIRYLPLRAVSSATFRPRSATFCLLAYPFHSIPFFSTVYIALYLIATLSANQL